MIVKKKKKKKKERKGKKERKKKTENKVMPRFNPVFLVGAEVTGLT